MHAYSFHHDKTNLVFWVVFFVCIIFIPAPLSAQEESLPPELQEAPESLFSMTLMDTNIDFFLTGLWDADLSWSNSWNYSEATGQWSFSLDTVDSSGLMFEQKPNLTAQMRLWQKLFFETEITETWKNNILRAGWTDPEADGLQLLQLGLIQPQTQTYPFLVPALYAEPVPGIYARLGFDDFSTELLLLYSQVSAATKRYQGTREVISAQIIAKNYLHGLSFRLPDVMVSALALWMESPEGTFTGTDGKKYRRLSTQEYSLDNINGLVQLNSPSVGCVLVYYEKGGFSVGNAALGRNALCPLDADDLLLVSDTAMPENFDFATGYGPILPAEFAVTVDGYAALKLYVPGRFNPFEMANVYLLPESISGQDDVFMVGPWDGLQPSVLVQLERNFFVLSPAGTDERSFISQYPLQNGLLYNYPDLFTGRNAFSIGYLTEAGSLNLGQNVSPDSIQVLFNGRSFYDFTFHPATGILTTVRLIADSDVIEISYRYKNIQGVSSFSALAGMDWTITEGLNLQAAATSLLPITGQSFSLPNEDTKAFSLFSAKAQWESGSWMISAQGAFEIGISDFIGIKKLAGMENDYLVIDPFLSSFRPASVPTGYSLSDFIIPRFRDMRIDRNNALSAFYPYDTTVSVDTLYPETPGSPAGPYPAYSTSSDGVNSVVKVLEYTLTDANSWTGMVIPIDSDSVPSSLVLYINAGNSTNQNFFLEIGDISEDLDADGILDSEASPSSLGYSYNPTGLSRILGTSPDGFSNGITDTEDIDDNGMLDGNGNGILVGNGPTLVPIDLDALPSFAGTSLHPVVVNLTKHQQESLTRTKALRLIIENTSLGTVSNSVVVGPVLLQNEGPRIKSSVIDVGASISASLVPEDDAFVPATNLPILFPQTMNLLHPDGGLQSIYQIVWSGLTTADQVVRTSFSAGPVKPGEYGKLKFFLRSENVLGTGGAGEEIFLEFLDGSTPLISMTLSPTAIDAAWTEIVVDLVTGQIEAAGNPVGTAALSFSSLSEISSFEVGVIDSASGSLYLDEIHFTDPRLSTGWIADLKAVYSEKGDLIKIGDFPLLSAVDASLQIKTGAGSLDNAQSPVWTEAAASFSGTLAGATVKTEYSLGTEDFADFTSRIAWDIRAGNAQNFLSTALTWQEKTSGSQNWGGSILLPGSVLLTGSMNNSLNLLESTAGWKMAAKAGSTDLGGGLSFSSSESGDPLLVFPNPGELLVCGWQEILSAGENTRQSSLIAEFYGSFDPVSFTTSSEFKPQENSSQWLNTQNSHILKLQVTAALGEDFTFVHYYEKPASGFNHTSSGDFISDWSFFWNDFLLDPWWLATIPYLELFPGNSSIPESADGKNTYAPKSGLTLARKPSYNGLDLLLPINLNFEASSVYLCDKGSSSKEFIVKGTAAFDAVNLFGDKGLYPIFKFYDSDALTQKLTMEWNTKTESQNLILNHTLDLLIKMPSEDDLTLNHKLRSVSEEKLLEWQISAGLGWHTGLKEAWEFPLFTTQDKIIHTETLSSSFTFKDDFLDSWSTGLLHASSLKIGEDGSISARAGFSVGGSELTILDAQVFRISLTIGIHFNLVF